MPSRTRSRAKPRQKTQSRPLRERHVWLSLVLAVLTFIVYSPVRNCSFINYDDDTYVTRNTHVQAGVTAATIVWATTSTDGDNWHPVTWLSHALDYELFGGDASWHHLTSAFLHAINTALLFELLWAATGMIGRSAFVAMLFALHPFNVESVAWVSERKNVLSMLLFLLTLAAYGWYARRPNAKRYSLVALTFALGLAAKPMLVTVPCVLLLLDFWPLNRVAGWKGFIRTAALQERRPIRQSNEGTAKVSLGKAVVEKLPLLALSAADALITIVAQHKGGAMRLALSVGVRLENAIYAYAMYLWKGIWPAKLAPFYPHPGNSLKLWQVLSAAALLLAISVLVFLQRKRPYLVLGWLWFLGTLVPVIGIIQVGEQAMADRYAYLPLIGIFLMVAWGAGELIDNTRVDSRWRIAAATAVLTVLAVLTWHQIGYWDNSVDLWSHTVAVTSNNYAAEDNLGGALLEERRSDEALPHFENAARINPLDPTSRLDMASVLAQQGQLRDAVEQFQRALPLVRDASVLPLVYENIAVVYSRLHDYTRAKENYQQALRLDPHDASARRGLAQLDLSDAAREVSEHPTGEAYFRLGQALENAGRVAEARTAYEQATKLDPALHLPNNVK